MCAQTSAGLSFRAAVVFISPDGSVWTEVSGHGASVAVSGGDRAVGEQHTYDGDIPIIKAGKRGSIDVTVRYVYTEEASDPFEIARAAYEAAGGTFYVQYSPKGGGDSNFWFTTGAGIIQKNDYPGGEAGDGEVTMSEFVCKCASITKATAST